MTKWIIRRYIKEAYGMKCSIKKHPLISEAVSIFVPELGIGSANVFAKEVYNKNKSIFEYVESLKGEVLQSGERII